MKKLFFLVALGLNQLSYGQNVNGTFESWRTYSVITAPGQYLQSPYGWHSADSIIYYAYGIFPSAHFRQQVFETDTAHSGVHAAKLITQNQDTFHIIPALFTNAMVNLDLTTFDPSNPISGLVLSGGTPISDWVTNISAWIKFYPVSGDTATILAQAIRQGASTTGNDSIVGSGRINIYETSSSYIQVATTLTYTDTTTIPDILRIVVVSGNGYNAHDSTTLYIDDVLATTAFNEVISLYRPAPTIYPNPATIFTNVQEPAARLINIYDRYGRNVLETIPGTINIAALQPGVYFVALKDEFGNVIGNKKLLKQ